MKLISPLFSLLLFVNTHAQTGTFTDPRDGNVYPTIAIGNKLWFRENLRLQTSMAHFPNFNRKTDSLQNGNYYSNQELNLVCPTGWHLATIEEFEDYIQVVTRQNNIPDSSVIRSYNRDADSSFHTAPGNLNPMTDTLLKFRSIGWVEGNKVEKKKSFTIWLRDTRTSDGKFHAHIGPLGYIIHTHLHNVIDKPKRIRKFAVRCVCEVR